MDYLDALEDEPIGPEKTWEVTLLDADPISGLPECKWEVVFHSPEEIDKVARSIRKRNQPLADYTTEQRTELREKILPRFVRGWHGMVFGNFQRMSEWALRRPQLAAKFTDGEGKPVEIPFNQRNLSFVVRRMEHIFYNLLVNTATSTEEAVIETVEKKKEDSNSSVDSSLTS